MSVEFDDFWWTQGDERKGKDEGLARGVVRYLGRAGFVKRLGVFPVDYIDGDICVFQFPPLGVRITASKVKF